MSHASPVVRPALVALILWIVIPAEPLLAQAPAPPAAPADQAKPAEAVTIADEPTTVDPATVVPPALAKAVTVDFAGRPLSDVVKWLHDEQKLGVLVDSKALSDGGVLLSEPVADRLQNEPIHLLLDRLRTTGVGWYVDRDVLHVTTLARADERRPTIPYNLGDLLDAGYEAVALIRAIQGGVDGPWTSNDPHGGSLVLLGDVIFVRHTDAKHREIAGLLAALRKHGRRTFTLDSPRHAALRARLERNVTVNFADAPLDQAVAELARIAAVDLRLDRTALRAANVRERSPVEFALEAQSLATALRGLLAEWNLTWILRDGVLWVTTESEADRWRKAAVYDVRDLCRDEAESMALRSALVGQTRGPWDDAPDGGSISFPRPGVMVVRQTEPGHDEVLQLLENYRFALKASKPRQRGGVDPEEIVVRYYRVPTAVAEALAPLLPKLVAPDSWTAPNRPGAPGEILHKIASSPALVDSQGYAIDPSASAEAGERALLLPQTVLVVRQSRAAHGEIAELIDRVERGDPRDEFGLGGGLGGGMGGGIGGAGGGFFAVPSDLETHPERKPSGVR